MKILAIALDYCTKSPLQNFTEKPHLLNFEDLTTMFCPRLPEKKKHIFNFNSCKVLLEFKFWLDFSTLEASFDVKINNQSIWLLISLIYFQKHYNSL